MVQQVMIVGFIGLGMMGGNAARNILRAGYAMVVNDIRPDAARPLLDAGLDASRDAGKAVLQPNVNLERR